MKTEVKSPQNFWLYWDDLTRAVPGREDSTELLEDCQAYLLDRTRTRDFTRRFGTTREILAAKVKSAASGSSDAELKRMVKQQQAVIDRLLAFVPMRAQAIQKDRLEALATTISQKAEEIFETRPATTTTVEESDPDTSACHRITVDIPVSDDFDIVEFAQDTWRLNRVVAESLPPAEFQAIRIFIEPVIVEDESD